MIKLKQIILMLCLVLSGALCYANGEARTGNENDGHNVPIELKESTGASSLDKSSAINPFINGHVLAVVFSENLGQVSVELATAAGASVQCLSVFTPNGLQVYIPNTGNYVVTITLSNGDVYAGEFAVMD
ncbi:MAG: hypothetical protein IJ622_08390 [Bacteroidales bacterium]|nr:hypothetical protein [Bacteroidales bacterium]